jgi:hypothetical protein
MLLHLISALRPRYEGDPGGGTGGGNPNPTPAPAPASAPAPNDDRPSIQGLMQRHNNDAMGVITTLLTENYGHRDRIRQLQSQLPAQGAVVLTSEQATAWASYQQLGAPDALTTQLKERETVQGELATLKQDLLLRDVAAAAKYDVDVLRTIGGDLTYLIKDEQVNGKSEKRVYIKDGDKETLLADHAKTQWGKFLPSLQLADATPARPAIGTPQARTPQQQPAQGGQAERPLRKTTVRF